MGRAIFLEENVMGKPDQPRPPFFFFFFAKSFTKEFHERGKIKRDKEEFVLKILKLYIYPIKTKHID